MKPRPAIAPRRDIDKEELLFALHGMTVTFLREFGFGLWVTLPLLLSLGLGIALVGQAVGKKEGWSRFDSLYWSFVTATTVGYGDIRPVHRRSRILAILIAFMGLVLTGFVVAVAVRAATVALESARK
jgi:Ion channel